MAVLDEATSALDEATEGALYEELLLLSPPVPRRGNFQRKKLSAFFFVGGGFKPAVGVFCFRGHYASLGIFRQASDIHLSITLRS